MLISHPILTTIPQQKKKNPRLWQTNSSRTNFNWNKK